MHFDHARRCADVVFPLRLGKARDALALGSASSATTVPVTLRLAHRIMVATILLGKRWGAVERSNALVKACFMIPPLVEGAKTSHQFNLKEVHLPFLPFG
jgi:hypothetical protein